MLQSTELPAGSNSQQPEQQTSTQSLPEVYIPKDDTPAYKSASLDNVEAAIGLNTNENNDNSEDDDEQNPNQNPPDAEEAPENIRKIPIFEPKNMKVAKSSVKEVLRDSSPTRIPELSPKRLPALTGLRTPLPAQPAYNYSSPHFSPPAYTSYNSGILPTSGVHPGGGYQDPMYGGVMVPPLVTPPHIPSPVPSSTFTLPDPSLNKIHSPFSDGFLDSKIIWQLCMEVIKSNTAREWMWKDVRELVKQRMTTDQWQFAKKSDSLMQAKRTFRRLGYETKKNSNKINKCKDPGLLNDVNGQLDGMSPQDGVDVAFVYRAVNCVEDPDEWLEYGIVSDVIAQSVMEQTHSKAPSDAAIKQGIKNAINADLVQLKGRLGDTSFENGCKLRARKLGTVERIPHGFLAKTVDGVKVGTYATQSRGQIHLFHYAFNMARSKVGLPLVPDPNDVELFMNPTRSSPRRYGRGSPQMNHPQLMHSNSPRVDRMMAFTNSPSGRPSRRRNRKDQFSRNNQAGVPNYGNLKPRVPLQLSALKSIFVFKSVEQEVCATKVTHVDVLYGIGPSIGRVLQSFKVTNILQLANIKSNAHKYREMCIVFGQNGLDLLIAKGVKALNRIALLTQPAQSPNGSRRERGVCVDVREEVGHVMKLDASTIKYYRSPENGNDIKENDIVEFTIKKTRKSLVACKLKLLTLPSQEAVIGGSKPGIFPQHSRD